MESVLVDKDDGSWNVRLKGPGELMADALSAVREALGTRLDPSSLHIYYEPSSRDGWIKGNWTCIAEEMSAMCRINLGSLLSCEPSWTDRVCLAVPSYAQISSFLRRGLPESLGSKLEELTGIRADVDLVCSKETTSDYSSALPEAPTDEEPQPKNETGKPAGDVIFGSRIKMPVSKIAEAKGDEGYIAFEGRAFKPEAFTSRRNRRMLSFVLSDRTGSISCILAGTEEGGLPELPESIKVAGRLSIDERGGEEGGEPILNVESIERSPWHEDEVTRPCQRVELHCHTKMSALDSVCDPFELVKRAKELGHSAIAVTDHGVVHAFPQFYKAAKELGLKSVFGMEGYLKDPNSEATYHFTVLVKDRTGLKNLYRMVTKSHLENFRRHPIVPRELAELLHEGLLYGTACASGELFSKALSGADDEALLKALGFYDYVEVMPASNSAFLVREGKVEVIGAVRDINRRLIGLAKALGKPFVATGDVHFVMQEDAILRQVLLAGQDYRDFDDQPSLHLRSTEEMLGEFSYLGEKDALAAVVINPNALVSMVEELKPVPDGLFTPVIEGAGEEVRDKAVKEARRLYGDRLPEIVEARLEKELKSIIGNGFASIYLIAMRLVHKSMSDGYLVGSRGSVGSSLVATLLGITEVNPLPPHYRCPRCKSSDFGPFKQKHGFDLPDLDCPACGARYSKQGHDIPFEVFLGFEGDKVPDIDLNFSGEYQPRIHKYCEEMFGSDNVFRAGTIATIAEKTAYGFVRAFEEHTGKPVGKAQSTVLSIGTSGVRRTTGQHPGGIIVLPQGMDIHEFTPVQHPANSKEKGIITTHFEYTALHDNLLKLDLLGHDDPTMIRTLEDITGRSYREVPFDDPKTMSIFSGIEALGLDGRKYGQEVGTIGIPEFGTRFVRGMLAETKPSTFDELVRISGLSHGTNVWLGNAQEVIMSGRGSLSDVISVRDDIMNYLISKGMEPKDAFQIMERVRKGKGLLPKDVEAMGKLSLPEWYADSCNRISYMFPKAHACAYVMMAFRIAYAKVHDPQAFYGAYFTVRAFDFDPSFADMSIREIDRLIREIDSNRSATQKDKDKVPVLEVVREALLRGTSIKKVDIEKSHPVRFSKEGDSISAPLSSVPRIGQRVALKIAEDREARPFTSVENLKERSGLTKSHIDALRECGALSSLKESEHMPLF